MADGGWEDGGSADERDEWVRPAHPRRPATPGPLPRDRKPEGTKRTDRRRGPPVPRDEDAVYAGPQYPRELVGYGARRDATDPRGYRSGARTAAPTGAGWQVADGLPTAPTVLVAGAAVVFAFVIGHLTSGGGGGTTAATSPVRTVIATTTTLPATHTVTVGESLSSIAGLYGLTTQDLASYNNISNINHVFTGEVLKIPSATTPTTVPATPTTKKK